MADAISMQELIDARTDAKTLEEAVNGDAVTTVLSRLGETYPTLSNALNQIDSKLDSADTQIKQGITTLFESGGLPATPFKTKALMTASALVDGKYAMVTDDTVNNGLYVKTAGAWVKSEYDPVLASTRVSNQQLADMLAYTAINYPYEWIDGAAINTDINNTVFAPGADRAYIKVELRDRNTLEVTGARTDNSAWVWVFVAFDGTKTVSYFLGNGSITVPKNTQYAYRTVKSLGVLEKADMKIMLTYNTEGIKNVLNGVGEEISATFVEIEGAAAETNPTNTYQITAGGVGRRYIKINVEGYGRIRTAGGVTDVPEWRWVFVDAAGRKIGVATKHGNVEIEIPDDAKYALRTTHVPNYRTENAGFSVLLTERVEKNSVLSNILRKLEDNVTSSSPLVEELPINRFYGALPDSGVGNPYKLNTGANRAYTYFDVQNVKQLLVENSYLGKPWVFIDDKGENKQVIPKQNGVPTNVPTSARTAVLGLQDGEGTEEPFNLSVKAIYGEGVNNRLERIESALPENYTEERADLRLVEQMELDLAEGRTLKISDFGGSTQHEQIDNAIAFIKMRGRGILDMESGVWIRDSAVLLPNNCWLYLNNAEIKLADGTFDNVIRNEGIVPNPDPFGYALELNRNVNIRVFGNSITESFLSGADVTYAAPDPVKGGETVPWIGDAYGWRALTVLFVNVNNYKLHDFGMRNSKNWAVSQEHGCTDFEIYNIDIQSMGVKNGDGIDLRSGCSHGKIYNITGATGDDMVALSALKGFVGQYPSGRYYFPLQIGGHQDIGYGVDIHDIDIDNITGYGSHQCVRVLASGGSKTYNININGVADTTTQAFGGPLVRISSGYGTAAAMGDMYNITVNNVKSNNSQTAVKIDGNLQDVFINKVRQLKTDGIIVDDTAVKDNVVITNVGRV